MAEQVPLTKWAVSVYLFVYAKTQLHCHWITVLTIEFSVLLYSTCNNKFSRAPWVYLVVFHVTASLVHHI